MMNTTRCCQMIRGEGRFGSFNRTQCQRKATIEREGKPYCKQHDTVAAKSRMDDSLKRHKEKTALSVAHFKLNVAASASYRKHCGERALKMAQEDLLGQALETVKALLDSAGFAAAFDREQEKARALLAKLPYAVTPRPEPQTQPQGTQERKEGAV